MRKFNKIHVAMAALLCGLFSVGCVLQMAFGDDPPVSRIQDANGDLMRSKLTSSQNVLEGLCRNDFELISRGAREMKRISHAAEWPRHRDPVYEHFSTEFRRQCNLLEDFAKSQNREAVSFTYLHMTTICISCHDYVRDSRRIANPNARGDVQLIPSQWPEPNQSDPSRRESQRPVQEPASDR